MESVEVTGNPYDQHGFGVRFDWGLDGLRTLASGARVVVVVDVLSFTTCVDIATSRGAAVLPFASDGELYASDYARAHDAVLAGRRSGGGGSDGWSLSSASLLSIPSGTRLVLPSPNGSALAVEASRFEAIVIAGCLRNAASVAAAANRLGPSHVGDRRRRTMGSSRWSAASSSRGSPGRGCDHRPAGCDPVTGGKGSSSCFRFRPTRPHGEHA